jgi:hypothetical protein
MDDPAYPWYRAVRGDDIEQGDILEGCPVFLPPDDLAEAPLTEAVFRWEELDVIVMSQTCDMVKGREKVSDVLLCPTWRRSELTEGHLATPRGMEDVRRGNLPGFHLLAECRLGDLLWEVRVVDFRRVHSLPLAFVRGRASKAGDRLRLLPPYREHLSQSFARFFMRVGLPVDVPPFR